MIAAPKGIIPRREHEQRRANEIHQAVNRYMDAGLPIPKEWFDEYNDLVFRASDESVFQNPVHDIARPEPVVKTPAPIDLGDDGRDPNRIHFVIGESDIPACGDVTMPDETSSPVITTNPSTVECLDCLDMMQKAQVSTG